IAQVLTIGNADYVSPEMEGHLRVNTLFISDNVRRAVNEGRADFTPCFLSEIPGLFKNGFLPLDVALIHVSPPDEHGFCSFGVEVGVTKTAAPSARIVIAEVNPNMPRTLGDAFIHISKITYAVPVDYELPETPTPSRPRASPRDRVGSSPSRTPTSSKRRSAGSHSRPVRPRQGSRSSSSAAPR
ncbi:MAG: hypothetical protein LAO05_11870, partial [Acidobacteriia bacterium]|nr:hypothetical protein [Terriglobia bacterium]